MLDQNNDERKGNTLYNISQTIVGAEINYSFMKKNYLTIGGLPLILWDHFNLEGKSIEIYIIQTRAHLGDWPNRLYF